MHALLRSAPLLACLLTGCSAQILEEVGEVTPPRDCTETTKLFNTFSMRAKSISWKGAKGDASAMLTVELVFDNDKKWPIALSNSGNGVLYAVEFSLHGNTGGSFAPREASGVTLIREPKALKEPKRVGPMTIEPKKPASKPSPGVKPEPIRDVNYPIKPREPETGKLVFQAPRENYLLIIERKFGAKPVPGMPTDHIAVCKISGNETAAIKPASASGISGVY